MEYKQRLEWLKEWLNCIIDGRMPYFNGTYWSDVVFKHSLPDEVIDELANDHNIWIHQVYSPKLLAIHYPFEEYCKYKISLQ